MFQQDVVGCIFQPNTVKLGHRPESSGVAPGGNPGKVTWGPQPAGTDFLSMHFGAGVWSSHLWPQGPHTLTLWILSEAQIFWARLPMVFHIGDGNYFLPPLWHVSTWHACHSNHYLIVFHRGLQWQGTALFHISSWVSAPPGKTPIWAPG